jgi:hypothetical protein
MIRDLLLCRDRIEAKRNTLIPDIRWDGRKNKVGFVRSPARVVA